MTRNDNSVNIKTSGRPYHHGDLRAALVAAGLDLLKQRTADDLSLREVARCVGVSATAVYRHFADKQALLVALREEGQARLAIAQRAAMTTAGGGQAGFDATGLAYVQFALANPALFRLMMNTLPQDTTQQDAPQQDTPQQDTGTQTPGPAMKELLANAAAVLPQDATAPKRQLRALRAWALVHGIAMLVLEGRLPRDEALISELIRGPVV